MENMERFLKELIEIQKSTNRELGRINNSLLLLEKLKKGEKDYKRDLENIVMKLEKITNKIK